MEEQSKKEENITETKTNITQLTSQKQEPQKSKSVKIIPIIAATLTMVLVLGFFVFQKMSNPKQIFLTSITDGYKQLANILKTSGQENVYDMLKKQSYQIKSDTQFHLEVHQDLKQDLQTMIDELNKFSVHTETSMDQTNQLFMVNAKATYDTKDIVETNIYAQNNNLYLQLVNLLDEYIEIPIDNYQEMFKQNENELENIHYLINKIGSSFVNTIEEKDFKESKEKIKVNGKEVNTTKISYQIDQKKAHKIISSIAQDIKNDTKAIEIISKYTQISQEEIIQSLEDFIKEESSIEEKETILLSIYINKNKAIRYELEQKETNHKWIMTTTDKQTTIEIMEEEQTYLTIIHKKINEKEYNTTVIMGTVELIFTTIFNENKVNMNYELEEKTSKIKIHGLMSIEQETIIENKEYKGNTKFMVSVDAQDLSNIILLELTNTYTTNIGISLEEKVVDHKIPVEELTEEKINEITEKLFQNEAILNFINALDEFLYTM